MRCKMRELLEKKYKIILYLPKKVFTLLYEF